MFAKTLYALVLSTRLLGGEPSPDLAWDVKSDGKQIVAVPLVSTPYVIHREKQNATTYKLFVAINQGPNLPPRVVITSINIGGTSPEPGPNPVPPPPPPPPPIPTKLFAIIVEETKDRTPDQAVVLLSPEVRALFEKFETIDPTNDEGKPNPIPVDKVPYVERAKGDKLPVMFITDGKSTVFYEGTIPTTIADVKSLVEKIKKEGVQ